MFQIEWAQKEAWEKEENSFPAHDSKLDRREVRRAYLLHWEDHCLECAPPLCYSNCPLYFARADKKCARLSYGIYPNTEFKGLFDFGADVRFRRWGKLETIVYGKIAGLRFQRLMDRINRFATYFPRTVPSSPHLDGYSSRIRVIWKDNFAKVRNRCFSWMAPARENATADDFVIECFSPEAEPFGLVLEFSVGNVNPEHTFGGEIKLRHSFNIVPGWNFNTLPAGEFGFGPGNRAGKITIYPENNAERRLIFTWLDLVQYQCPRFSEQDKLCAPAAKVKCVAWDLDNTLWKGILAEGGQDNLILCADAVELIKKLDARGIVQSIVSKNNHSDAWAVVQRFGLQDYFLYPAINWQLKSTNLRRLAERLNINVDTLALIDDSPFERSEVQSTLPQVRVYSEQQIGELLNLQEFDSPVTEASQSRRVSYLAEMKRQEESVSFGGDYKSFLRSCEMKLRLFVPQQKKHILRCLELIQRANQLNLSGNRYSDREFRDLLSRPQMLCVALECKDRFGVYGIVGFVSVDEKQHEPTLKDFVLSCRVAQKQVEHTVIQWLAALQKAKGRQVLRAELTRTNRNQPLLQVFGDLGFVEQSKSSGHEIMELPLDPGITISDIIALEIDDTLSCPSVLLQP